MATGNAMIRESPFGAVIGSVVTGLTYRVVGECPDGMWYKIDGDLPGYVYAGYLAPEEDYDEYMAAI